MDYEILLYNELAARCPKTIFLSQSARITTPRYTVYFGTEGYAIYENERCVCFYDLALGIHPGEYNGYPLALDTISMTLADIRAGDFDVEE